jgi:hypothetical protein
MGAGTSASTYIQQGATASCNVTSLVPGGTAFAMRVRFTGSISVNYGDGATQYQYSPSTAGEYEFSHVYSAISNNTVNIKGNINTINRLTSGSGGLGQSQPAFVMTQPETVKFRSLGYFNNSDFTGNWIFDVSKLPQSMTAYYNAGANQSYGSIGQGGTSYLPTGLTQFWGYTAVGYTGSINPLPSALTIFQNSEVSNFTGNINSLPPLLTRFSVPDTNSSLTGDITNLPIGLSVFYIYGSTTTQTITGDLGTCLNSRPNITDFRARGANTISCDFSTFSPAIGATGAAIELRGNSTASGNINQITSNIKSILLISSFSLSGNIADIPLGMTSWYISGANSQIITGDISSLASKQLVSFLINSMPNHTVTGNLNSISNIIGNLNVSYGSIYGIISSLATKTNLSSLQLTSGTGVITGDVTTVGPYIRSLHLSSATVALTGDIGLMPPLISTLVLNSGKFSYTSPRVWTSTMGRVIISSTPGFGLTTTQVDNILIDLAQYSTNWTNPLSTRRIDLTSGNSPRSSASDAAKATLEGRGVTVLTAP